MMSREGFSATSLGEHHREIELSLHLVVPERNVHRKPGNGGRNLRVQSNEHLAVLLGVRVVQPRNRRMDACENVTELLKGSVVQRGELIKGLLRSIARCSSLTCGDGWRRAWNRALSCGDGHYGSVRVSSALPAVQMGDWRRQCPSQSGSPASPSRDSETPRDLGTAPRHLPKGGLDEPASRCP
jgi:hypothetical protein